MMKTYRQFITESKVLNRDDIAAIVFNALGIDTNKTKDKEYLSANLADFDSRKNILQAQAIKKSEEFDQIQNIVKLDYRKYTIGTLINTIEQLL